MAVLVYPSISRFNMIKRPLTIARQIAKGWNVVDKNPTSQLAKTWNTKTCKLYVHTLLHISNMYKRVRGLLFQCLDN